MTTSADLGTVTWRKSSRSTVQECVEIAALPARVAVRDSKSPDGAVLLFSRRAFRQFLQDLRVRDEDTLA
ncbi:MULTISPECIES: DUF397 domain-containing protein [Saccharopolyspora]|uniref:DUF397 domain-containing protein n=1 Tax=Saccharopolyspora gregorii TaxID=33914 RepID=A0ABP6RRP0_9PSEU|nr:MULTISPECIES: DUF397 domain-containing protein [unclassified Saccharopolyspora]MCA1189561.1 DUF397 domain-containing protein [Saccharopolyspora sp. 6T]MCA1195730.1 DUF397 domain-containing protein [Saccharopolyspora sp. 6V]MCA1228993.1 DUF397 domain-containing protein [Saccharopolyspora sp. 6M]MCA1282803.1 DUF397 domain-containing protein [Saccharopolyspora sp. 7B]